MISTNDRIDSIDFIFTKAKDDVCDNNDSGNYGAKEGLYYSLIKIMKSAEVENVFNYDT